jgi:hypothetical protein
MNDEIDPGLERELRDGLHRGGLPLAPDSLRQRLAQLPDEPARGRFAGIVSGVRLAALGTALAMVVAFVVVARSLPGPAGVGPGGSLAALAPSAGPGTSASPSASASPGASAVPSPAPSVGPSPTLSPAPASPTPEPSGAPFVCGTTTLPKTGLAAGISDVRVGAHPGYDRIVFEFSGSIRPSLTVAVAQPPFVHDASGQPVDVPGTVFLSLKLFPASGYPTYQGPASFAPGYANLESLVNTGDYEGYVTWVAGLKSSTCYRISTLTGPTRIVVDIEAP